MVQGTQVVASGRAASRSAGMGRLAPLAPAVAARGQPGEGTVEVGEPLPGRGQQRGQLGALEGDGGALRVVLVVGVGAGRGPDDAVEIAGERRDPLGRVGALGREQPAQRLVVPHDPSMPV